MNTEDDALLNMQRFLHEVNVAALATVDQAGLPYLVQLYIAWDEHMRGYFTSDPRTAHAAHINGQPHVRLAAHAPHADWRHAHGIQLNGICERVPDERRGHASGVFCQRFPSVADVFRRALAAEFYCVTPSSIRWIDNRVHFGFKADFTWPLPDSLQASNVSLDAQGGT